MPTASELADALLAADAVDRAKLLRETAASDLAQAIEALGHRHEPAAAEVLVLIDAVVDDRALKKAARREAHRLRSAGLNVPRPVASSGAPGAEVRSDQRVELSRSWATDIDPTGTRAIWLLGERRLGGAWLGSALLNDLSGLEDINTVDTTRKRVLRELEERRREGRWVDLPPEYALRLVREAVDVTRERGASLPPRYRAFVDAFGEAPGGPERPLVYETISPLQATFTAESVDQTARLLTEPEVGGWHVDVSEALRPRVLEVARAPFAALVVPTHPPEQEALMLVGEAARESLSPSVRRALRRRLEETGYVFVATNRLAAARLAVSAARAIDDPLVPAERHPLLRLLLTAGLARLVRSEIVGGKPAPEVLVELVERGAEQVSESGRSGTARPSGLILPR
jgi:hypothetical protein